MKRFALPVLALLVAPPAFADKAPDAESALTQWKQAVEGGKVDAIMKLYDKKAIFISTFAQAPLLKREQIEGYYKKVVANPDIRVDIADEHTQTFGIMAIISGRYDLSYSQEGETISVPARFTFVFENEGGKWLIVNQHSSRVPLPEEDK